MDAVVVHLMGWNISYSKGDKIRRWVETNKYYYEFHFTEVPQVCDYKTNNIEKKQRQMAKHELLSLME